MGKEKKRVRHKQRREGGRGESTEERSVDDSVLAVAWVLKFSENRSFCVRRGKTLYFNGAFTNPHKTSKRSNTMPPVLTEEYFRVPDADAAVGLHRFISLTWLRQVRFLSFLVYLQVWQRWKPTVNFHHACGRRQTYPPMFLAERTFREEKFQMHHLKAEWEKVCTRMPIISSWQAYPWRFQKTSKWASRRKRSLLIFLADFFYIKEST